MYPIWTGTFNIYPKIVSAESGAELNSIVFRGEEPLFDVDRVAISSLENQYAALIARRIGGVIVKNVVAERIRKENPLLGDLALLAMYASDRADLRQWSTLPKVFKVYRASLPAGEYKLKINGDEKSSRLVVKPGGKVFVLNRNFH